MTSIVELTVGVMCSCLTSFPGFFRYHLPLFRSISSFVNFSFKGIHLLNPLNRSSDPSNSTGSRSSSGKRLATKDIKVTLGSRVDGRGRFLNPASVSTAEADWLPLSEAARNSSTRTDTASEATRREYYEEMAEKQWSRGGHSLSPQNHHTQRSSSRNASHAVADFGLSTEEPVPETRRSSVGGSAWWKYHRQSNTLRTGYWDIMSSFRTGYWDVISPFRTGNAMSSGESKMHSASDDSAV